MLTRPQETFIHLVTSIARLRSALETLLAIRSSSPDNKLLSAAFRFSLVEYASPFTPSHGTLGKYSLDASRVPTRHLALHCRIISARHEVHAHHDLKQLGATVTATGSIPNPSAVVQSAHIDELIELPNIHEIIELVEELIGGLEIEQDNQLAALNA